MIYWLYLPSRIGRQGRKFLTIQIYDPLCILQFSSIEDTLGVSLHYYTSIKTQWNLHLNRSKSNYMYYSRINTRISQVYWFIHNPKRDRAKRSNHLLPNQRKFCLAGIKTPHDLWKIENEKANYQVTYILKGFSWYIYLYHLSVSPTPII